MTDFQFTPTEHTAADLVAPYFEDARAGVAPYYSSNATLAEAQAGVTAELAKLGGGVLAFREGKFNVGKQARFGYQIEFVYGGMAGVIRVAGLPLQSFTERKKERVLVQALLVVRDQLKASVTQKVFSPKNEPLLQYLLVDGQKTFSEVARESGKLPLLGSGS